MFVKAALCTPRRPWPRTPRPSRQAQVWKSFQWWSHSLRQTSTPKGREYFSWAAVSAEAFGKGWDASSQSLLSAQTPVPPPRRRDLGSANEGHRFRTSHACILISSSVGVSQPWHVDASDRMIPYYGGCAVSNRILTSTHQIPLAPVTIRNFSGGCQMSAWSKITPQPEPLF